MKGSFQLFGTDFVFDQAMRPWMIEINAGPCVKDGDNGILEKMLEVVLPEGVATPSTASLPWEMLFEVRCIYFKYLLITEYLTILIPFINE
jgi:hypothetical protein